MNTLAKIAAAAILLGAGTVSASAACNNDASTETVLGAGSGALVGGLASNSIGGAVIGALLIALFESVVAAFLSQPIAEAVLYAVLLIVLFVRPGGILGEVEGRRA